MRSLATPRLALSPHLTTGGGAAGGDRVGGPQEAEPTMPMSVGNQLQRPPECPPAPRKLVWAPPVPSTPANKRSRPSPSSSAAPARRAFFPVARPHHRVLRPAAQEADPRRVTLARRTGRRGSGVRSAIGRGDAVSQ
jgi:hypothetical protein